MILVELNAIGVAQIKDSATAISNIENNVSANLRQRLAAPRAGQRKANINSLYTTMSNTLSGAMEAPKVKTVVVERRGKQVGTVKVEGTPKEIKQSFLTGKDSHITLHFPAISSTHGLVIKPKPGDLVIKKDGRTVGTYNVHLSDAAVKKYRKQLENTTYAILKEEVKKTLTKKQASGVKLHISAILGVAADKIIIADQNIIGRDISKLVRAEVKKRMGKGNAKNVLNYRTGEFVRSIRDVKVMTHDLIAYTFDKEHYGVHEKSSKNSPKGENYTRIHALTAKGLGFKNKKTGDAVGGLRFVDIPERPIIQQSIRSVAYKLFDRKFGMEAR